MGYNSVSSSMVIDLLDLDRILLSLRINTVLHKAGHSYSDEDLGRLARSLTSSIDFVQELEAIDSKVLRSLRYKNIPDHFALTAYYVLRPDNFKRLKHKKMSSLSALAPVSIGYIEETVVFSENGEDRPLKVVFPLDQIASQNPAITNKSEVTQNELIESDSLVSNKTDNSGETDDTAISTATVISGLSDRNEIPVEFTASAKKRSSSNIFFSDREEELFKAELQAIEERERYREYYTRD